MVGVDSGSLQADSQPKSSALVLGQWPPGAVLHSSNEPRELSQWLCHDDSTINIFLQLLLLPYEKKKIARSIMSFIKQLRACIKANVNIVNT